VTTLTRLPEAVAELVSVCTTAVPSVKVEDWPGFTESGRNWLVIGLTDSPGTPGYESQVDDQPGLAQRYVEDIAVRCLLHLSSGKTNAIAELRTDAASHVAAIDTALRAIQRKAGVWDQVRVTGGLRWYPIPNPQGTVVEVAFTITGTVLA